jgi:hypothetical protein
MGFYCFIVMTQIHGSLFYDRISNTLLLLVMTNLGNDGTNINQQQQRQQARERAEVNWETPHSTTVMTVSKLAHL